jgi:AbrB family looped-hinge helix DNA binding protein
MAKVSSKLEVTIPQPLAERFGIQPGDEVEWTAAEGALRLVPAKQLPESTNTTPVEERLKSFDESTRRQMERQKDRILPPAPDGGRGWTREELYTRGRSR